MNALVIPPSPNWYETDISACAPDNTLIYGSRNDIVIIENSEPNVPASVRKISKAHSQKVTCVKVNKQWGNNLKLIASTSEDKMVNVWDAETGKKLHSHDKHLGSSKVIGVAFAGEERVVSVSENGTIVLWNLPLNQTNVIDDLLGPKVSVSCISSCPHVNWLVAFGLNNGLVTVVDMRKNGKVLFKMRGHDKSVISLSWCPAPVNVFPKNPYNFVGEKKSEADEPKEVSLLEYYGYDEDDFKYFDKYLLNRCDNVPEFPVDNDASKESVQDEENISSLNGSSEQLTTSDVNREISSKPVPMEEEPRKEFLLASSAKEGNIYIWRAGTDGRLQTFLTLPNNSNNHRSKSSADKLWITLCWIAPNVLLSSSKSSELLAWALPKPQDSSKNYTVVHRDHSALLFSISAPLRLYSEYDWRCIEDNLNAWTLSQDRLLLNTKINNERTNLACYPTIGGSVFCMKLSPLDPNRLAIGTTDGFVKIWNLSRPHTKQIVMSNFYQKIQGAKVSAMAWHPVNEHQLACGTSEGRICIIDVNNKSKAPVTLPQYFKSEVYVLEWGSFEGNIGLYAVGEGRLVLFDLNKSNKDPIEFNQFQGKFIYSMSWKPDNSRVLLVTKSGQLIVCRPDLSIIKIEYLAHRLTRAMWHPNALVAGTKENNWVLALSNCSKNLTVYDFSEEEKAYENVISNYQFTDLVHDVCWSHFEPSHVLFARDMGIVQVWDVRKNEIISTMVNEGFESVLSAIWSPLDPDYVISGSRDSCLRVWKVSEHPHVDENELNKQRKKVIKHSTNTPQVKIEQKLSVKPSKTDLFPVYYSPKDSGQLVTDLRGLLQWKDSLTIRENSGESRPIDLLDIFGSQECSKNLINLNESTLKQRGQYSKSLQLSLFNGDISKCLNEAIEEKRVNVSMLSLAPMVSFNTWLKACETYADQLTEEANSDPQEIAMYYLACHKVEKAVDSLCNGSLYREAFLLAKCRLLGQDVIDTIIQKWAIYCLETGYFEVSAQCYIYLGKYEEAASVLFRRTDPDLLGFAKDLAEKVGNEDLKKAIEFRLKAFNGVGDAGDSPNLDDPIVNNV